MIIVRDAGPEHGKYRFTVIIKTPIGMSFYGFPADASSNYRYFGLSDDGFHDSESFGQYVEPSRLPGHWQDVVVELEKEAIEFAKSEGVN